MMGDLGWFRLGTGMEELMLGNGWKEIVSQSDLRMAFISRGVSPLLEKSWLRMRLQINDCYATFAVAASGNLRQLSNLLRPS